MTINRSIPSAVSDVEMTTQCDHFFAVNWYFAEIIPVIEIPNPIANMPNVPEKNVAWFGCMRNCVSKYLGKKMQIPVSGIKWKIDEIVRNTKILFFKWRLIVDTKSVDCDDVEPTSTSMRLSHGLWLPFASSLFSCFPFSSAFSEAVCKSLCKFLGNRNMITDEQNMHADTMMIPADVEKGEKSSWNGVWNKQHESQTKINVSLNFSKFFFVFVSPSAFSRHNNPLSHNIS